MPRTPVSAPAPAKKTILYGIDAIGAGHKGVVLTIGNFDGVHIGHQKILSRVTEKARELGGAETMAITFEPHPMKVLAPDRQLRLITTAEEKARLLHSYGMDTVLFIPFTREFASISADEFINQVLVDALAARAVIVGHGYAFGKGKKGTTDLLRRRGARRGFAVSVVRNVTAIKKVVSSSRIRQVIANGNVAKAITLLGRPFAIHGTVITGQGIGAKVLDTPTANITTPVEVVPKEGVYAVRVNVGGMHLDGVSNIGTNPTFTGTGGAMSYEVHLLDFKGNLRGDMLEVQFIERLRDEITFPNAEALKAQIDLDIARTREILARL